MSVKKAIFNFVRLYTRDGTPCRVSALAKLGLSRPVAAGDAGVGAVAVAVAGAGAGAAGAGEAAGAYSSDHLTALPDLFDAVVAEAAAAAAAAEGGGGPAPPDAEPTYSRAVNSGNFAAVGTGRGAVVTTVFHGSKMIHWLSILRTGIVCLSNTKHMTVGAACGTGAYFGFGMQTSLGYTIGSTPCHEGDAATGAPETRYFVMGVAEVDGRLGGAIDQAWCLTCSNDAAVALKWLVLPAERQAEDAPDPEGDDGE